ncbi:hypothetical protein EJ06DRAFT_259296 [Trichodelitschia bisporula]|uniref:Uncharacterized protein n=1 Tax=Trichodelitschia bisporula TaxID=703511 RepID=A0A6G1HJ98_9PEZI|nr:hypothetical protein EJ06DRAFT_259296 [Trichodelitschia bisporula]
MGVTQGPHSFSQATARLEPQAPTRPSANAGSPVPGKCLPGTGTPTNLRGSPSPVSSLFIAISLVMSRPIAVSSSCHAVP